MAAIAGGGTVTITADALVNVVRLGLLMGRRGVAIDAGKTRVVRRNLVAIAAYRSVVRDRKIGVVECSAEPTRGRVASVACLRVAGRDVVRHRAAERLRAEPRGLVAPVTRGVCRGQAVVVADVAIGASRNF